MIFRLLFVLLFLTNISYAVSTGVTTGEGAFQAGKLSVPYWYVLPENNNKDLPVVYFLHGRGGSRHMFQEIGGVEAFRSISSKVVNPLS